uniref:L1 transposable element RRM domain-containing protein n=1 Tax=Myripristis murdjan TaxID=586833 RepID=A0A667XSU8_9TELE
MPGNQQKSATQRQDTGKLGEASKESATKVSNTVSNDNMPSPRVPDSDTAGTTDQMAKEISSIYALLKETSETQESKLNAIQSATRAVESMLTNIGERLSNAESRLDFLEDAHKALEATPPATKSEVEMLRQKVDDLENRSRRNNLRFVGFPEGSEGRDAAAFLREVIPQLLETDFPVGPEIDRAHRSLARRRPDDQPPRAILARFLRYQDRERIVEAARKKVKVSWNGHHIMVFPDYSKLVTEKRAAFNQCKRLLHERRVKFSLLYPAVLSLKTTEGRREFTDPKKALDYIRSLSP